MIKRKYEHLNIFGSMLQDALEQMGALKKSKTFWIDDKLKLDFILDRGMSQGKMQTLITNTDDYTNL